MGEYVVAGLLFEEPRTEYVRGSLLSYDDPDFLSGPASGSRRNRYSIRNSYRSPEYFPCRAVLLAR